MFRSRRCLVLTGATGFLGHYLLAQFCRRGAVRCRLLLRPSLTKSRRRLSRFLSDLGFDLDALIDAGRVELFEGTLPTLDEPALMRGADTVVHAAGHTGFHATAGGEPMRTNVDGTRALLDAAAAAAVPHFVFISTAFVCGRRTGDIPERLSPEPPASRNDYERSKWLAERLVDRWACGHRTATICRPSILFGDGTSGRATSFRGVYVILRATEILSRAVASDEGADRHRIRLRILGRSDATCNLVPVDWAASRIAAIVFDPVSLGRVHHITNPDPPSHAEIKGWLEDYFDIGGGVFCGALRRLHDPNHYEELFYSLGNVLEDYFRHGLRFESRWAARAGSRRLVDREAFLAALAYAQARKWNGSAGHDTGAAVAGPASGAGQAISPRWYFEEFLPGRLPRSSVARIHALTTTVAFRISTPAVAATARLRPDAAPAEAWVCRFERGRLVAVGHDSNGLIPEFGYQVSYDAFERLVTAEEPLQAAFCRGDAQIVGNVERALRMVPIMAAFIREFPVPHA